MLTALKDIGEVVLKQNHKTPLDIIIENPEYETSIIFNFDSNYNFKDIDLEETKLSDYHLYLYRKGPSNGPGYSPTTRFNNFEKSFNKKFLQWFKDRNSEFSKIYQQLSEKIHIIEQKLSEIISQKSKKERFLLTIKIDGKYPFETETLKKEFEKSFWNNVKKIKKDNAFCSVCGEKKPEVFTTSEIYKFYNLDKKSYIAGGFDERLAWKNFPICEECFLKILAGKKYVEENLKFRFYGNEYFLIPHALLNNVDLSQVLEILVYQEKEQKITTEHKKILSANEREIIELLKSFKDTLAIYLLFLKRDQNAERIILLIEDILPSWISKIFQVKSEIDKKHGIDYTVEYLYIFFKNQPKIFMELINKIFKNEKIKFDVLINFFIEKIRQDFLKTSYYKDTVKRALINIDFLNSLGVLDKNKEEVFYMNEKFEELYKKYSVGLDSPLKKGVFLLGSLTQMLINIQYARRSQAPFLKNLKGLKMDINDMKALLSKVVNKLNEYGSFDTGKKEIAQEIARNFLIASEQDHKLSVDELNFYFVSGMALSEEIANLVYENKEQKEEKEDE